MRRRPRKRELPYKKKELTRMKGYKKIKVGWETRVTKKGAKKR